MKRILIYLIPIVCLSSCIGTDVIDDPMVDPMLTVDTDLITLLIGSSQAVPYSYTNEFGITEEIAPTWVVGNTNIATVSTDGVVTASGTGQTILRGTFGTAVSADILISVAENEDDIVKILIAEVADKNIAVGESIQLSGSAWNINNEAIEGQEISWNSSNEAIATIDETGLLAGVSSGSVFITASVGNVMSVPEEFEIGSQVLSADFTGVGGYIAVGTAELANNENGELILSFSDDFRTSFALGTFIYLSNSTSGSDTRGGGLELGEITSNAAKTFNISEVDANVGLDTYRYVIILCRPASLTFGFADFQ